ncbi:hypothetical protein WMY93_022486 [Mugilogobius chulae]|uniref:Uncharacterized protein n=1 Tax=Mugilogobius chulae TaxID=88201 RepID=A0AAW0NCW8_9GOBI
MKSDVMRAPCVRIHCCQNRQRRQARGGESGGRKWEEPRNGRGAVNSDDRRPRMTVQGEWAGGRRLERRRSVKGRGLEGPQGSVGSVASSLTLVYGRDRRSYLWMGILDLDGGLKG